MHLLSLMSSHVWLLISRVYPRCSQLCLTYVHAFLSFLVVLLVITCPFSSSLLSSLVIVVVLVLIVYCCILISPSLSSSLTHITWCILLIIRCPCIPLFLFNVIIPHHLHYVIVCLVIVCRLNDFVALHCPRWCLLSHVPLIDCCIGMVCLVDPHYPRFRRLSSSLMSIATSIDYCILMIICILLIIE